MADNKINDSQQGTKLPRLPQVHGSLSKLPSLHKKSSVIVPALSSQATQLPEAVLEDLEDEASGGSGATEAVPQPTPEEIAKAVAQIHASGKNGIQAIPSLGGSKFSAFKNEDSEPLPSGGVDGGAPFGNSNKPSIVPAAVPAASPAAVPAAGISRPSDVPESHSEPSAAPQPEFGGAALEDNGEELPYEEDSGFDAGERTVMLGEMEDDLDVDDEENQKTQINMSAMDYDPLSGKLVVESGKTSQREYILVRDKTTIGRVPKNDIAIADIAMSRHHAEIDKFREGFRLRDLDSANGTLLNGYRIRVAQLRNGDIIELGGIRFRFEQTGGDPEELWKGAPKIEYHPDQKSPTHSSNSPSSNSPSAPPVAAGAPPSVEAAATRAPSIPQQPQQMEQMLERQGGGLAAPQWGAPSPMTSPYMMGFSPSSLRVVNTTPLWANIVLGLLIVVALGSLAWFLMELVQERAAKNDISNREDLIKMIEKDVSEGMNAYESARFEDAIKSFNNAQSLDKDGLVIKDKAFFENYRKIIHIESDFSKRIQEIRKVAESMDIPSYEQAYADLAAIPVSSISYKAAQSLQTRLASPYSRKLQSRIQSLIGERKFDDARNLLAKLRKLPNTESAVRTLSQKIDSAEH